MGFAELLGMGRERNIQNENICFQQDLNPQHFAPFECLSLDHSVTQTENFDGDKNVNSFIAYD